MPGKSYWVQPLSYVISVSLGKGCYRHIRISADMTFDDLSCAILDAFMFDNDHLHGFFMDNIFWSRNEDACIWADDMDGEAIHVSANSGDNLLEIARSANIAIDAPCSGNGACRCICYAILIWFIIPILQP